jgi:hypothetical protein
VPPPAAVGVRRQMYTSTNFWFFHLFFEIRAEKYIKNSGLLVGLKFFYWLGRVFWGYWAL